MHNLSIRGACLGFSGDDRVISLHVPAAGDSGQEHPRYSFDLEYDADQPDQVVLRLLETDQDNFIQTVQRSIGFPISLLADLISQRRATAEEVAAWQDPSVGDE
jgi:hypothetical protein